MKPKTGLESGESLSSNKNLSNKLKDNLEELKNRFKECPDIIQKEIMLKEAKTGCCVFLKYFSDEDLLQNNFISPLMSMDYSVLSNKNVIEYLPALETSICMDVDTLVKFIMEGMAVFLIDGVNFAISCSAVKLENRSINEPDGEKNVRSARDGFIESLSTNMTILRRRIKNNNLKFKTVAIGNITNQTLQIAYIEGIANPEILNTLYNRIKSINIDGALSIGHIEQLITDSKYSPFPQYSATERPDKVAASLLEGRMAVMLDETPFVLIAPVPFISFFQASDDYSSNWMVGTALRLIRIIGVIIALTLPALYVSVTSFQYYLVPLNILVQLGQSRFNVAFPPIIEAILMEFTIDMLREASIRLPTYIGTTIGVVGGIIIGQAAVNAGIVSNLFIIIIGITAIASYVIPSYEFGLAIILLRICTLILSSFFGMVGIVVSLIYILIHLMSLESLGQPYLTPIIPFKPGDIKDTILRFPIQFMNKRPHMPKPLNNDRGCKNE